jgi:branched-chain amino acid transport system ATP-binding protein
LREHGGGAMLEVYKIHKSFNGFTAVDGVSLAVPARGITAVIGPNGAGKSTLFNLVTGHLRADGGSVALEGRDITTSAPHAICRMGVGRSFQHTNIFRKLTVFENVQAALIAHGGQARNFWGRTEGLYRDETTTLLSSLGLAEQADAVGGELSHGMQKQLELGIALASDPKLLLLDEPTAGMSASETREAIRLLERVVAERKLTLLFTEHDMDVVFSIAQKIAVLHQGKLITEGAPAEVRANPEVRRVYLGGRH